MITGRDVIRWIQDNHAEDLPVMIRREKGKAKEPVTKEDLEVRISIAEEKGQMEYKKYFLI